MSGHVLIKTWFRTLVKNNSYRNLTWFLTAQIVFAIGVLIGTFFVSVYTTRSPATFTYGTIVSPEPIEVCLGENLHIVMVDGVANADPNITLVAHTIYAAHTNDIVAALPPPVLLAGSDQSETTIFNLHLIVPTDDLPVGEYRYVRQAFQYPTSDLAGFDVLFNVLTCK